MEFIFHFKTYTPQNHYRN